MRHTTNLHPCVYNMNYSPLIGYHPSVSQREYMIIGIDITMLILLIKEGDHEEVKTLDKVINSALGDYSSHRMHWKDKIHVAEPNDWD